MIPNNLNNFTWEQNYEKSILQGILRHSIDPNVLSGWAKLEAKKYVCTTEDDVRTYLI